MEALDLVSPSQLLSWPEVCSCSGSCDGDSLDSLPDLSQVHPKPVFECEPTLNSKIVLWRGDPLRLDVDALVHPTNERFERCTRLSDQLYNQAGAELRKCLFNRAKYCAPGSVRVTKGYSALPRYIIHTASPMYKQRYQSAAENVLFRCYYNVLHAAWQCRLRSLVLTPIAIAPHHYPEVEATHLGVRVVRRFLERHPNAFDMVMFVVGSRCQYHLYDQVLRIYFPRDEFEQMAQCFTLPPNYGGERGEPHWPEREIRIKSNPIEVLQSDIEWSRSLSGSYSSEDEFESTSMVISIGRSKFAHMQECRDRKFSTGSMQKEQSFDESSWSSESLVSISRQLGKVDCELAAGLTHPSDLSQDQVLVREFQRQLRCERLQRRCRQLAASPTEQQLLAKLKHCIYIRGVDRHSRPILNLVGNRFLAQSMCTDTALNYIIQLLNEISAQDYVIVYFHSGVAEDNLPQAPFFTQLSDLLSYQHRKRLRSVLIVHPTMWSRLYFWWLKTFHFKSLKEKVTFVTRLAQLKEEVPNEWLLQVPAFVHQFE